MFVDEQNNFQSKLAIYSKRQITREHPEKTELSRAARQSLFCINVAVCVLIESVTLLQPGRRPQSWPTRQPGQVGGCRQTL